MALFGSARVAERHPPYVAARAVGRRFAEHGWAVVTGGGAGVMEGGNRGARRAAGCRSASTSSCRTSSAPNPYFDIEHTFDHFYARKVCFVRPS